jgi:hypothetical protein
MLDWMSDTGDWLSDGKNLQGLGTLVGAGGSIYGGIKQAEAAQDMIDLNNKQFEFNKAQILADEEDRKKRQRNYDAAQGIIPLGA